MPATPAARPRRATRLTALALALAAAGDVLAQAAAPAQAAPAQAAARHADGPQCRGRGVDPDALVHYGSRVLIHAPVDTVFRTQTDVERWPRWQDAVLDSRRLDSGPLRPGSAFRWTTPAPATAETPATTLTVTSTVRQLHRDDCVRWNGPAVGDGLRIDEGTHVWTFTKVRGGTLVRTEESWTGDQVEADVNLSTQALGAGLETWLHDLKSTAESRTGR